MAVPMQLDVIGAIHVDFEKYQHVKVFALADAKNGVGATAQMFKLDDLTQFDKFKHIEKGKIYPADCMVNFESKGDGSKGVEIVIESIVFKNPVLPKLDK